MKRICSVLIFVMLSSVTFSQTATSVANGNWMSPFTWNCTCVPLPGCTVTINHAVILDTSFYVPSGGITINPGGSLTGNNSSRDIWVNGGSLNNKGTLNVRYLWNQTGTFSNSGTITLQSFLNYVNFTNIGIFQNVDSFYTTGDITNNGSFLNIDSTTNGGIFINNGIYTGNQFTNISTYTNNNLLTFTDITNNGTLINADTITGLHSGWNRGTWNNNANAYFHLDNSFLNGDSLIAVHAVFNNDGKVIIDNSWYNIDTTKGTTGSIVVADTTINWGSMKGSFDFCDLTPPSTAPFIDYNFGTVDNNITWCTKNGIEDIANSHILVFPNPANERLYIISNGSWAGEWIGLEIYNMLGENIYQSQIATKNPLLKTEIDISGYEAGIYIVVIRSAKEYFTQRIQIIK